MKTKISLILLLQLVFVHLSFSKAPKVYCLELKGEVNSAMNRYVKLGFDAAQRDSADYILLEMNTYGGAVLDADSISQRVLRSQIPVWVFIDGNAGSAGAFISISCDSIYMAPASVMGASTVINQNVEVMPEKIQSYMKGKMRAAAEESGRNPEIAVRMVGENLQTDSALVITLTTKEALDTGYCEGEFSSAQEIIKKEISADSEIVPFKLGTTESLIAFFLSPTIKGILLLAILAGLYFEFQTPGVGFPILVSIAGLVLYFVPDYLHGFLQNWEIAVFLLGIILLILEIFVIPGFGVAGISGGFLILSSLILSMLRNDFFDFSLIMPSKIESALIILAISCVGFLVFIMIGSFALVKNQAFNENIAVSDSIDSKAIHEEDHNLIGEMGIATSVLRPSGKVKVNGILYDAEVASGFTDKETKVKVIRVKGNILVVRPIV